MISTCTTVIDEEKNLGGKCIRIIMKRKCIHILLIKTIVSQNIEVCAKSTAAF